MAYKSLFASPLSSTERTTQMKILAIETSCDETAAAVVKEGREVLSSVVASQVKEHVIYGGVVPEIASRRHTEAIVPVVDQALSAAGTDLHDIDAVAVTHAPGLIGSLLVGVNYAKGLAFAANLPLIPVHHLRSHIAANYIAHKELTPPFLCLVASGGHSHIIEVADYTKMQTIGRTRDDAAGEVFDKVARTLGLDYPGGVHLDAAAKGGDPVAFTFARPKMPGYDMSFSGIKTAAINYIHNFKQRGEPVPVADMAASFREAVVDILTSTLSRAAFERGHKTIVLAGGVSANSRLREKMAEICTDAGWRLYMPPLELCGDNAAMVGAQAYYEYLSGVRAGLDLNAKATLPID